MGEKRTFRIITKNYAADSKIRFPQKIDFKFITDKKKDLSSFQVQKISSSNNYSADISDKIMSEK